MEVENNMRCRDKALKDYDYDEMGTLLYAEIFIEVCSPNSQGAVDPTTSRRYGVLCQHIVNGKPCHSKLFREDEQRSVMICKSCGGFTGYRLYDSAEMQ
jgi:hypothetical protein